MKAASCLVLCVLATGVAGASGATQAIRVPSGYRVDVYAPGGMAFWNDALYVADYGRGVIYRIRR